MSSASALALTTRNAGLEDLVDLLRHHQAHKVDVVAHSDQIRAEGTRLRISTPPALSERGVTTTAGLYTPTGVCDPGLASKLSIPQPSLRPHLEHKHCLYHTN